MVQFYFANLNSCFCRWSCWSVLAQPVWSRFFKKAALKQIPSNLISGSAQFFTSCYFLDLLSYLFFWGRGWSLVLFSLIICYQGELTQTITFVTKHVLLQNCPCSLSFLLFFHRCTNYSCSGEVNQRKYLLQWDAK